MQEHDSLEVAATPQRLVVLGRAGVLDPAALERAFGLISATPPREVWRRWLSRLLLVLGSLLAVAGVVFFFAFNWGKLPSWGKLGLLQALVAGAALVALRRGSAQAVRQVALLVGALLVGPLLGVYGQTYQTGADPWGLFALWAALIVPWTLAARAPALWLVEVVLIDVAIGLWFEQSTDDLRRGVWGSLTVAGVNGAAWLLWEVMAARGASWAKGRWWPRLMASSVLGVLLVPAEMRLFGLDHGSTWASLGAEVCVVGLGVVLFRRRDLFMVAASLGVAMVLMTSLIGRMLMEIHAGIFGVLVIGVAVMVQVGMAVMWLRQLGASREGA
jgi:uncharacterized membrane protein